MKIAHCVLAAALATSFACKKTEEAPAMKDQTTAPAKRAEDPNAIPPPDDVAAPPADAEKTASGLASKVLSAGTGTDKPTANDVVRVHYTGWTTDGHMFDSSVVRKEPAAFPVNKVIRGWTEGLQLMTTGEKRRFWIPAEAAYGNTPRRPGAPAGPLTFDVELISILRAPAAPADVAAAPKDAKKTASGLAYKVIQAGTGTRHPLASDTVEVQYTGWTTSGQMFDSSVTRGAPATFPLANVIRGWTEGVQLMVEGEKTRFWIPGSLAYGDTPNGGGAPTGTLVFDIELLKIR